MGSERQRLRYIVNASRISIMSTEPNIFRIRHDCQRGSMRSAEIRGHGPGNSPFSAHKNDFSRLAEVISFVAIGANGQDLTVDLLFTKREANVQECFSSWTPTARMFTSLGHNGMKHNHLRPFNFLPPKSFPAPAEVRFPPFEQLAFGKG